MKKIFLLSIIVMISCLSVNAQTKKSRGVPAYPYFQEIAQPDGSFLRLRMMGDGVIHWFENEQGEKILRNKQAYFTYAITDSKGYMVASENIVSKSKGAKRTARKSNKNLFFSKEQMKNKEMAYFKNKLSKRIKVSGVSRAMDRSSFPTTGVRRGLMILAEFSDMPHQIDASVFADIMNKVDYNNTGSFRDYYLENSYGQFDITTDIVRGANNDYVWVTLPNGYEYYGANSGNGNDTNPQDMVYHACLAADARGIDFTQYDSDADGTIDNIMVIHSGYGEEAGADEGTIWSHRWNIDWYNKKVDGMLINDYITFPELSGAVGQSVTNIGVLVHEFGHALGLPDYYDTDYSGSGGRAYGLGDWDVMSGGSWNNNGITPAQHNAYSKYMLGWIDLPVLNSVHDPISGEVSLKDITTNKTGAAYMIKSKTLNEFFVIENRQQNKFNSYIPHHGMLVYHVDRNYKKYGGEDSWYNNNMNNDPSHPAMEILFAGGLSASSSHMPFPGSSSVSVLDDFSGYDYSSLTSRKAHDPSLVSWDLENTEASFMNIREEDGVVKFNFSPILGLDLNFKLVYKNDGINNSLIDYTGTEVLFRRKNSSPSIDPIKITLDSEGNSDMDNVPVGVYDIEIKISDKIVDSESIVFDSIYEDVLITSENIVFELKKAMSVFVSFKKDDMIIPLDFTNSIFVLPANSLLDNNEEVEIPLDSDGRCIIKNLKDGVYDVRIEELENQEVIYNGTPIKVAFNTIYKGATANSLNEIHIELIEATRLKFIYTYKNEKNIDIDFSSDNVSMESEINEYICVLDASGECTVKDAPDGVYTIDADIADKRIVIDGLTVFLSFSNIYDGIKFDSNYIEVPLKLKSFKENINIKIFPNPTTGYVQIEASLNAGTILEVYDMSGLLVLEKIIASSDLDKSSLHGLDLTALQSGVYNIVFIDGTSKVSKRIIKY
jgi:M6 family metalloprotease-like protein